MTVRPQLTGVRCSILAASIAALLASAAPAAAQGYESNVQFFLHPTAQPDAKAKDGKVASKKPGRSARRKAAIKEASKVDKKEGDKLPAGPLQIVISIKKQQLTLYSGGQVVAHSQVSTGVPGHPTPQGVFSVIEKQIYHESNLYSSAPMPFMQRITWSGVAMHQGVVPGHPASHGCIRLPGAFAKRLWALTKVGVRVIIAQDEVALSDISNKRLFTALPQIVGEAAPEPIPARLRYADNSGVTDTPLKGSIDAAEGAQTERGIDQAAQGAAEAILRAAPLSGSAEAVLQATPLSGTAEAVLQVAPLSGTAEARSEPIVEQAARAGIDELTTGSVVASEPEPLPTVFEKATLAASGKDPMLKPGPISVFISRKLGKLFVRKGFAEVFEAPVSFAPGDEPLGTHVFTALQERDDGTMRWNVASLPTDHSLKKGKSGEKRRKESSAAAREVTPPGDPNAALERVTIPPAALARITELMTPGASLIISDLGYSYETGRGTDFIVLTR